MPFSSIFKKASSFILRTNLQDSSSLPSYSDGEIVFCKNNVCVHPPALIRQETDILHHPGYLTVTCRVLDNNKRTLVLSWIPNTTLRKHPNTIQKRSLSVTRSSGCDSHINEEGNFRRCSESSVLSLTVDGNNDDNIKCNLIMNNKIDVGIEKECIGCFPENQQKNWLLSTSNMSTPNQSPLLQVKNERNLKILNNSNGSNNLSSNNSVMIDNIEGDDNEENNSIKLSLEVDSKEINNKIKNHAENNDIKHTTNNYCTGVVENDRSLKLEAIDEKPFKQENFSETNGFISSNTAIEVKNSNSVKGCCQSDNTFSDKSDNMKSIKQDLLSKENSADTISSRYDSTTTGLISSENSIDDLLSHDLSQISLSTLISLSSNSSSLKELSKNSSNDDNLLTTKSQNLIARQNSVDELLSQDLSRISVNYVNLSVGDKNISQDLSQDLAKNTQDIVTVSSDNNIISEQVKEDVAISEVSNYSNQTYHCSELSINNVINSSSSNDCSIMTEINDSLQHRNTDNINVSKNDVARDEIDSCGNTVSKKDKEDIVEIEISEFCDVFPVGGNSNFVVSNELNIGKENNTSNCDNGNTKNIENDNLVYSDVLDSDKHVEKYNLIIDKKSNISDLSEKLKEFDETCDNNEIESDNHLINDNKYGNSNNTSLYEVDKSIEISEGTTYNSCVIVDINTTAASNIFNDNTILESEDINIDNPNTKIKSNDANNLKEVPNCNTDNSNLSYVDSCSQNDNNDNGSIILDNTNNCNETSSDFETNSSCSDENHGINKSSDNKSVINNNGSTTQYAFSRPGGIVYIDSILLHENPHLLTSITNDDQVDSFKKICNGIDKENSNKLKIVNNNMNDETSLSNNNVSAIRTLPLRSYEENFAPSWMSSPELLALKHNLNFPESVTASPVVRRTQRCCRKFCVDLSEMRSLRLFFSDPRNTKGQLVVASRECQYKILHFHHSGLERLAEVLQEWHLVTVIPNCDTLPYRHFMVCRPAVHDNELHPEEGKVNMVTMSDWLEILNPSGQVEDDLALRKGIFLGGLEPGLRKVVWPFLLHCFSYQSTAEEREQIFKIRRQEYEQITNRRLSLEGAAKERFMRNIQCVVEKDVVRTDRGNPYYAGDSNPHLETMKNILLNYAVYDSGLGYLQGMSDLLAPLLAEIGTEADSFWCFVGLMRRTIFVCTPTDSDMERNLNYLRELVREMVPNFYEHLQKHTDAMELLFCHRWILLCFKREFPEEMALKMWEACWANYLTDYFNLFLCLAIVSAYADDVIAQDLRTDEMLLHFSSLAMFMDGELILRKARGLLYQFRQRPVIPCTLADLCRQCGPGMWDSGHAPTVVCRGTEYCEMNPCPYRGTTSNTD